MYVRSKSGEKMLLLPLCRRCNDLKKRWWGWMTKICDLDGAFVGWAAEVVL